MSKTIDIPLSHDYWNRQPNAPTDEQVAYAALWRCYTDDPVVHEARMILLAKIGGQGSDAQRQALEWMAQVRPEIIAPPECSCDDPECLARHTPLTLRQAYDNCLERLRQAEDALTVTKEGWMEEAAMIVTARMALYSEGAMGFPRLALSEAASAIRAAAIRNHP